MACVIALSLSVMKINSHTVFPYPVLKQNSISSGYDSGRFNPVISDEIDEDNNDGNKKFEIHLNLEQSYIENLIKDSKAEFCVEVNCSHTHYSEIITPNDENIISIKSENLFMKFSMLPLIYAKKDLNISSSDFLNEYKNYSNSFEVKKGQILAAGLTETRMAPFKEGNNNFFERHQVHLCNNHLSKPRPLYTNYNLYSDLSYCIML